MAVKTLMDHSPVPALVSVKDSGQMELDVLVCITYLVYCHFIYSDHWICLYNDTISDIDECFEETHNCSSVDNRKCNNTIGGYECICDNGYEENINGTCVGK